MKQIVLTTFITTSRFSFVELAYSSPCFRLLTEKSAPFLLLPEGRLLKVLSNPSTDVDVIKASCFKGSGLVS